MIGKKMEEALNSQVNAELYSAYLYMQMAAYFKHKNLPGFANWMTVQVQEEMLHATKFYNYILDRGGQVKLMSIDGPPTSFESALGIFEMAYAHEQKVTGLINNLVNLAIEQKDHAANMFMQWFVNEQVEEEANASGIVEQLKMADGQPGAVLMLDREMAARVFTPPAAGAGAP
ncbi:MAG: ferritin [Planctomycetes bacterium GWF2_50_10]|nr:MAG: ferritin [Planctomycetes bacterium GWF2_50_10]